MIFIRQFFIIILISFAGELLNRLIPYPVPASIYGLILMFASLKLKIFPLSKVKEASAFLIDIMPLMFVPPGVAIIESIDVLKAHWIAFLFIGIITTVITMGITGFITQLIIRLRGKTK